MTVRRTCRGESGSGAARRLDPMSIASGLGDDGQCSAPTLAEQEIASGALRARVQRAMLEMMQMKGDPGPRRRNLQSRILRRTRDERSRPPRFRRPPSPV